MAKYRKKPVVVDAIQWNGVNLQEVLDFAGVSVESFGAGETNYACFIRTRAGLMCADRFDWIVRGVQGEFYPVKPDVFEATYEKEPE